MLFLWLFECTGNAHMSEESNFPSFFCILFPSCSLSALPPPQRVSSPKPLLSGTSELTFPVEARQLARASFTGWVWWGSPHRKKELPVKCLKSASRCQSHAHEDELVWLPQSCSARGFLAKCKWAEKATPLAACAHFLPRMDPAKRIVLFSHSSGDYIKEYKVPQPFFYISKAKGGTGTALCS